MRVLIIAPHFDDEVLMAGGLIAKHKDHWDITVAGLSWSEEGNTKDLSKQVEKMNSVYKDKLNILYPPKVGDLKGHREPEYKPDMYLEPRGDTMKKIIKLIHEVKPHIVITTHPNDFHTDHRAVGIATKEAVYQASRKGICGNTEYIQQPLLLYGEVDLEGFTPMNNQIAVALDRSQMETKIQALLCYTGFISDHPDVAMNGTVGQQWVLNMGQLRGAQTGHPYAEVFEIGNIHPQLLLEHVAYSKFADKGPLTAVSTDQECESCGSKEFVMGITYLGEEEVHILKCKGCGAEL